MGELKRKGILLLLSALTLVSAGAYLTFAWYTKMTSVSGMVFDAAQWEFTANYEVSDFEINVNSYSSISQVSGKRMAAPGTAGEIPIVLGAKNSNTDVDYEIWIDKSTMSPEFQERIYFYKDKARTQKFESTSPIVGTIPKGQETEVTIYWEWVYEFSDVQAKGVTPLEKDELEFNTFDTEVGKRPDLYEDLMSAKLTITGTQASPADN